MLYNTILSILSIIAIIYSFSLGYRLGKGENPVEAPKIPQKRRKKRETKEQKEKIERFNKIIANIERYDGTERGQIDI